MLTSNAYLAVGTDNVLEEVGRSFRGPGLIGGFHLLDARFKHLVHFHDDLSLLVRLFVLPSTCRHHQY